MQAAVLYEPHTPLLIEEFKLSEVAPQHVRVRLVASGVCHSEWHIVKGEWPHIPRSTGRRSAVSTSAPRSATA